MPSSARDHLGYSEQRWPVVENAMNRGLARAAKCRRAVPRGPDGVGETPVAVLRIDPAAAGGADAVRFRYAVDEIASPIHMYVDVKVNDRHIEDELALAGIVEAGAARLGALEDDEVIQGGGAPAPAGPGIGRAMRYPQLARAQLNYVNRGRVSSFTQLTGPPAPPPDAPVAEPTGLTILHAIDVAIGKLEAADRPGPCGLLIHTRLLRKLELPPIAGAPPLIHQVEQMIDSNQIAGTNALSGNWLGWQTGAILFRLEPPAVDIVHTMLPTITFLGRQNGQTFVRIEEEIVVRILDQHAVHRIVY